MRYVTQNLNIREVRRLSSPAELRREFPLDERTAQFVTESRETVKRILAREDDRLLAVVGPCSIHDPEGALEYARRLAALAQEVKETMFVVMRVYFEKPRTRLGWKGLINDPKLDDSFDVEHGLRLGRGLLLKITEMGLPTATEFLDPLIPQYIADLVSWAAIGARTTESQTHREMASGLSMPVGFKNGTDGTLDGAIDALGAARHAHHFLGVDDEGATALISSNGNPWGHIVSRGGRSLTNYDAESLEQAAERLKKSGLDPVLMVDCSHANSAKRHERQEVVWQSLVEQRCGGNKNIIGVMIESYLEEGNQPFPQPVEALRYGVSITDACLNWTTTERMLRAGDAAFQGMWAES